MKKRILSIILILSIVLGLGMLEVRAYTSVEIVNGLGILKGSGSGLDDNYLASKPTRANASMIILRMLGLEEVSLEYKGIASFRDASTAGAYWQPVLAYLNANPSVGFSGYEDGTFRPNETINAQMMAKVLLTILGYKQDVDFSWQESLSFAESKGIASLRWKNNITNQDVALAIVEALYVKTKNGLSLVTELVNRDVIDIGLAEKYGFVIESSEINIRRAYASGRSSITLEFVNALPANVSVVLRKDIVGINHKFEFSNNRKTIVITTSATLSPDTYTVVVGNKVQSVKVEKERATTLVIDEDRLYKTSAHELYLQLLNQYGEEMSLSKVSLSVTNRTSGTRRIGVSKTTYGAMLDTSLASLGDQVYLYALDNESLVSTSASLVVQALPSIKRISVEAIEYANNQERAFEKTSSHIIKLKAYDQYGQEYKIRQSDIDKKNILLISSNSISISASSIKVDRNGNLVFATDEKGQVLLSIIVATEGISATANITVYEAPYLSSLKVDSLPSTIFKNERVEVNVLAYDQYGDIYEVKSSDIIFYTSSNMTVIPAANIRITSGILSFNTINSGNANISCTIRGKTTSLFSARVNDGNIPYIITGIDLPFYHFEQGITNYVLDLSYIKVVDQFGGESSLSNRPQWDSVKWGVLIDRVSGKSFTLSDTIISTTNNVGRDIFNIYITRDGKVMDKSGYSFSLTNVAAADISVFDIVSPKILYGGSFDRKEAYTKYISLTGYTLLQEPVMLKTDENGLPTIISNITLNSNKIYVSKSDFALRFSSYFEQDETVLIMYWKDGRIIQTDSIEVKAERPKVATLEYDTKQSFVISTSDFYSLPLKVFDQYGVAIDLPSGGKWITNSNYVESIEFDNRNKQLHLSIKGEVFEVSDAIVSYIAQDGSFSFRGFYRIMPGSYD